MFRLLFRKNLTEIFRSYFFDAKKNKMRSRKQIILYFLGFFILIAGILGFMFTSIAYSLCPTLISVGCSELYFLIMSGIAILLGAFGSIFNTYSTLYLSRDNDLLLSLPIPARDIILSRLSVVYLLGSLYSLAALIPTIIVYWCIAGISVSRIFGALALILIITSLVLILSCLLGWCVAKLSQKLKGKSFITVLASLVFIVVYYVFFYRAEDFINDILEHALLYGERLDSSAHFLILFGRIGTGDFLSTLLFLILTSAALFLTWLLLKNTFLGIITGKTRKKRSSGSAFSDSATVRTVTRTPFSALVRKEFKKFTSSSTYMLNCGLGILLIPALGILLLVKAPDLLSAISAIDPSGASSFLASISDTAIIIVCVAVIACSATIDVAAPSISLEGHNLWIPQSLPIPTHHILLAKATPQFLLTLIPTLFTSTCILIILRPSILISILYLLFIIIYSAFSALFSVYIGLHFPVMTWTSETTPIKQGAAALIAIFGTFLIAAIFATPFFLLDIPPILYLTLWILIFICLDYLFYRWLQGKGSQLFRSLQS